jgi:hypothetical protein
MQITGITKGQFEAAVAKAAATHYNDNLRPEFGTEYSTTRFRARVLPKQTGNQMGLATEELAPGQRRSANVMGGMRRVNAVCWHAYRDVLIEVFNINPNAKVRTGMAKYLGRESFYELFPETGRVNIGSMMYPVTMPECCDC